MFKEMRKRRWQKIWEAEIRRAGDYGDREIIDSRRLRRVVDGVKQEMRCEKNKGSSRMQEFRQINGEIHRKKRRVGEK